ncbi:MAG: Crp/Fnr family transcriptional regulator [Paucibacter sp.]|nr:Crp/Fnr family transcriptional regulator [Roseateles sp.]
MTQSAPRPGSDASGDVAAPGGRLSDTQRIRIVLGRSPHTGNASGEFLDRLAALGRIQSSEDGELIHSAWRPIHRFWMILSGGLRVTAVSSDGTERTIAVLGEGSYYAAGSLVKDGMSIKSEVHSVGETQLAVFDVMQLEQEFGSDKGFEQYRRALLYQRFWAMADIYRDVLVAPLPQRLARRLLGQALTAGRDPDIELRVTQSDLATMLGASRSRVNAVLRQLEADGAIRLGYRQIVIQDLALLRQAAGSDVMPI